MILADELRALGGIARSLVIYRRPDRRAGLDRMHARFVSTGDLAFDIGAHVGDRVASLRRLGVRVIAVEPQPALVRVLGLLHGRDPGVVIEPAAVGARDGAIELHLNLTNPTVSTASPAFIAAANRSPGWQGQHWTRRLVVEQVTLDTLIARHGVPHFCKIDVEGLEDQVLQGLGTAIPALSFEWTSIRRPVARAALTELARIGDYRFNAALGESQRLQHARWLDADGIRAWLDGLPDAANSGDVYAVRELARG